MTEHGIVHATFTLERSYPVPLHKLFQAWADPEVKVAWFASGPTDYQMEFRPGGIERNRVSNDGREITWESLYREIVPDERIVYTSVLFENATVATVSLTTVEFANEGDSTRLVLVEAAAYLDGREQPAWRESGTADWLDALGRHVVLREVG
jgi:uncharacterized protein YndB with AHSA1/START domain